MLEEFKRFLRLESAGGVLLIIAAIVAMLLANSPMAGVYQYLIDLPVVVQIGPLAINKPLLLWINDGLMAIFFFLVGLELKREIMEGELSNASAVAFPAVGAIGGMVAPALIFVAFNYSDPVGINGWAIPAATDIAFALGILSLFGSRVPITLKVFLVSLAIMDDMGAILIIAIFYTSEVSLNALLVAAVCLVVLFVINNRKISALAPYIIVGIVLWVAVLKSGVHATLAGVALAMFIPMRDAKKPSRSPLKGLEHELHNIVALIILPVFAFANAGVSFENVTMDYVLHPVPLGIALGLFFGKQIGIFGFCYAAVRIGWISLPKGVNWGNLYGASLLCGIGFTMSLFIGSLAFTDTDLLFDEKLGILIGSLLSGTLGYLVLNKTLRAKRKGLS